MAKSLCMSTSVRLKFRGGPAKPGRCPRKYSNFFDKYKKSTFFLRISKKSSKFVRIFLKTTFLNFIF